MGIHDQVPAARAQQDDLCCHCALSSASGNHRSTDLEEPATQGAAIKVRSLLSIRNQDCKHGVWRRRSCFYLHGTPDTAEDEKCGGK